MLKPAVLAALIGFAFLQPGVANEAKPASAPEAKPASVEAKPASVETKPRVKTAKPASPATKRSSAEPKPAGGETKPAAAEAKPAVEAKPAGEAKPSVAEAKPAGEAKPSAVEAKPSAVEAKSAGEAKPARSKAKAAGAKAKRVMEAIADGGPEAKAAGGVEALIAMHAKANNVPEDLIHRVVMRESRYNPRAVGRGGAMGLMQIKYSTARSLGYSGPPAGLLDADTNLTYAVRYLAGAYKVANGDHSRSVAFYARGYYYDAKRKGILPALRAQPLVLEARASEPAAAGVTKTTPVRSSQFVPSTTPYLSLDSTK